MTGVAPEQPMGVVSNKSKEAGVKMNFNNILLNPRWLKGIFPVIYDIPLKELIFFYLPGFFEI